MRLLVIKHDHVSPLGPIAERFAERGYEPVEHLVVASDRFARPDVEPAFPSFAEFDAVVSMGAKWSTYDRAAIGTWVEAELDQLRAADRCGVPVLGICFGGQLLATAHGGTVHRSDRPELGWAAVTSRMRDVVPDASWFQWHFDRWELPPGAVEIARNAAASQAFLLRRNLAVQFHPELTPQMLAGWIDNGGSVVLEARGIEPSLLLAETARTAAAARRRARALVDGFLDRVAASGEGVLPVLGRRGLLHRARNGSSG